MTRHAPELRYLLIVGALVSTACGKFQQARECGTFVKTVNAWLSKPGPSASSSDAGVSSDPKQIAVEARHTATHYAELSQTLAGLHIQSEDLAPRVQRYEAIANDAARTLLEVADALDRGDLEQARRKR
ncbi:MAG: hypothetical protein ABW061_17740, partial [Polyangiaceae bacterium]